MYIFLYMVSPIGGLAFQCSGGITHTYGSGQILRYCSWLIVLVKSMIVANEINNVYITRANSQFWIELLE